MSVPYFEKKKIQFRIDKETKNYMQDLVDGGEFDSISQIVRFSINDYFQKNAYKLIDKMKKEINENYKK